MWLRAVKSGFKTAVVVAISAGVLAFIDTTIAKLPAGTYTPLIVAVAGVVKAAIKKWELRGEDAF